MTDMTRRLAGLPEERRAEFLARLRAQVDAAASRGPRPRPDTGPAPLSHSQETLWFLDRLAPGSTTYSVPLANRIRGPLDVAALRDALAGVVARHEALRTAILARDDGPMQVVAPEVPVELPVRDVPPGPGEPLARARALLTEEFHTPFDLAAMPLWRAFLVRLAPDDHLFVFNVHHVVFDGWSMGVFSGELAELYRAAVQGGAVALPELTVQYPDYACWQREWLSGDGMDELAGYWRGALDGAEVLEFPTDRPRGDALTFAGAVHADSVPAGTMAAARALALAEGVTPFAVYVGAFLALLQRYSGMDDIVIGSPTANRRHTSVEPVIGFFINMMVLRGDLSGNPTFRELIGRLKPALQDAFVHGDLPFGKLVDAVQPPRDPSRSPIFQIVFTLQNAGAPITLPGLELIPEPVRMGTSRFDMSWNLVESEGEQGLLGIEFNTDLFDPDSVARFAAHYRELLTALVAAPDAPVGAAAMLTEAERADLLRYGSGPSRTVRETTVVAEFEARVAAAPDAIALVCAGEQLTYAELDARADRLAAGLREHGAGPGATVGLCLRRTPDLTAAMLGVLKTGAAYVPLDPANPPARLAAIAADAGLVLVLAHPQTRPALSGVEAPVLEPAAVARTAAADPPAAATPDDVAYVIYTSGSTGQPKGVLIRHRSVVNFADTTRELFDLTPADRILGFASATFDVSVFETFSALLTGARLHLVTDDERLAIDRLQQILAADGITVIDLPPTVMPLLDPEHFTDLRIAFVGGEAFSGELVNRWNRHSRLFNGYGPTECTVTTIVEECHGTWDSSPPIGLPMANHVAHVLDPRQRLLPVGVPGELVIGGAGLAVGYLGSPELTTAKFFPDPFGTAWGGRLYRTGDLVKRLPDGRLVFLGRVDQQVKIRGLRIELGEVESAIAAVPGVEQVSVQPWTDPAGERHLVGYVAPADVDTGTLRDRLADRLPSYMIPSYVLAVPELPLTASGKVDRRRLPEPDPSAGLSGDVDEPRTETERVLLREVLVPLLHNDRVGVHDDFFRAGGNSLQAAQLMSAITRRFSVEVTLADFFASPTVAHLAATVDARRAALMSDEELLDLLETMPEDQLGRLLGGERAGVTAADERAGRLSARRLELLVRLRSQRPSERGDHEPVPMRPGAGAGGLVLLHPAGGELFCYTPLVRALPAGPPVTGFAADPGDLELPLAARIPSVAAATLRRLAAPGTHVFAGWSYGGAVAFETARQHAAATGELPWVVLLDSLYYGDVELEDEPTVRRRFVYDLARLSGRSHEPVRAALKDRAPAPAGDAAGELRAMLALAEVSIALTDAELVLRYRTFRACSLALQTYRPARPYPGPVTVVSAAESADWQQARWRPVCSGPVELVRLPGDHYTLFQPPALDVVVAAVATALGGDRVHG